MRVFFSSLRCFFLAIRLRRFLTTEPTTWTFRDYHDGPGPTYWLAVQPDGATAARTGLHPRARREVLSLTGARRGAKRRPTQAPRRARRGSKPANLRSASSRHRRADTVVARRSCTPRARRQPSESRHEHSCRTRRPPGGAATADAREALGGAFSHEPRPVCCALREDPDHRPRHVVTAAGVTAAAPSTAAARHAGPSSLVAVASRVPGVLRAPTTSSGCSTG